MKPNVVYIVVFLFVFWGAYEMIVNDIHRRTACCDAPINHGCTHPDQRIEIMNGEKMCVCKRP